MNRSGVMGLVLLASVTSCAHGDSARVAAPPAADAEPSEAQAAAGLRDHHRHHHHGGITQFIAMSLDTLGTDDAKRPQIEKLQGDLHTCMAPARVIETNLLSTLADGVAAGAIDTAKVNATLVQLGTAVEGVHDCVATPLNALHALLAPVERAALVDKVQAHYEVWRQVNLETTPGGQEPDSQPAELADELGLTPDQVAQLSAAFRTKLTDAGLGTFEAPRVEAHLKAFETAFATETFDAKAITANANSQLTQHGARRMALFYETATPLLTVAQRTTLADHLRARELPPLNVSNK